MRKHRIQALAVAALLLAAACADVPTDPAMAKAPLSEGGEKVLGTVTCPAAGG